jgi:hypothetical protein
MKVFDLMAYIRKMLYMQERDSLFVIIGKTVANGNSAIGDLYDTYVEADGFLYIVVSETEVF